MNFLWNPFIAPGIHQILLINAHKLNNTIYVYHRVIGMILDTRQKQFLNNDDLVGRRIKFKTSKSLKAPPHLENGLHSGTCSKYQMFFCKRTAWNWIWWHMLIILGGWGRKIAVGSKLTGLYNNNNKTKMKQNKKASKQIKLVRKYIILVEWQIKGSEFK